MSIRCDQTAPWPLLAAHFSDRGRHLDLRQAFAKDTQRFAHFSQSAPYLFADLSKNLWERDTEALLLDLARACALEQQRDAMLAGAPINSTENRAVLHTLLRRPAGLVWPGDGPQTAQRLADVHRTLDAMLAYAERVRSMQAITDVVNIGIGGSDLGPQMAVLALEEFSLPGKRMHFVSNVDGHELHRVLKGLRPESSLFLVASKTFTTAETMTNARSALAWFAAQGGRDVARHFVALTSNTEAAGAWGISTSFGFWDWVGGRYSLWSAIGLPLAIAIGAQGFRELLAGAHAMDGHFRTAPLAQNLPVRLGLLDVWYRNFHGFGSRCIAPYHAALRRYPAYLQQLEMESNGKRVGRAGGRPLAYATAPVLWGEPGTNGQHAFFQMLHQGSDVLPLEIVAVRQATHPLPGHHDLLLANALAQAQALMQGQASDDGQRHFPGNRPSSFLLLESLTPASLGALIALQEHRVFVSGSLWGINSFDQWGVELGKQLAKDLGPRLASGDLAGLDGSTAGLLGRLRTDGHPAPGTGGHTAPGSEAATTVRPNYRSSDFLRAHMRQTMAFYEPVATDPSGGMYHFFLDDGTVYDQRTRHLVSATRFVVTHAMLCRSTGQERYRAGLLHALEFVRNAFLDRASGGYAWLIDWHEGAATVLDGTRHCYGMAFVMLAYARALEAGVPQARDDLAQAFDTAEQHFWQAAMGLYADEADSHWTLTDYRGQNANMHACEAMISAGRATGERRYIERAEQLAQGICQRQAALSDGWVWEHFRADWSVDWNYNRHDRSNIFRPWGYQLGHQTEWAKLLLQLDDLHPAPWHRPCAQRLFDAAMAKGWDTVHGGICYGMAPDGSICDDGKYHWVQAESLAAAALLALHTGEPVYWDWYDRIWDYCWTHFVDHRHGAWFRILDRANRNHTREKSNAGKVDYHNLGACYDVLMALQAGGRQQRRA